ncbi:MAG: phospho-N-acetylmuramoyl-pentapeptide-transferase [Acidimicrobiaceae bacterium]|nr:phospho-N-acetylmuramoyl-pentapeptide-transferase [Acidimicrobiaceae bacterium]
MKSLFVSGGVSLLVSLIGTPLLIGFLRTRGIGQQIREDGPQGHFTKAGTPTMGGIAIVFSAAAGYIAGHFARVGAVFTYGGMLVMGVVVACGIVGLLDDYIKVRQQRNLGLNKRAKFGGQIIVAVGFAVLAVTVAKANTHLSFTRAGSLNIDLHRGGMAALAVLMILATTNAVNLTDGLDGLAAGSATFIFAAYTVIGFWQLRHLDIYKVPQPLDLALVAVAMVGGCAGFLWWNAAPARIFMGDTGSLGIGAGIAALALFENVHLLLPIAGGLFVLETLSVVIQVASFRFFHRRVFRMAPIHHHFELAGWPETTVIIRFWILAALCTALALGIFYADFLSLHVID